jgi:hypothetical protein
VGISGFRRLTDIQHEKEEIKYYGKGTIVCRSWEEFDEAVKDISCALVSPGGTGLPRSYVQQLEKEGSIRVFRVWADDKCWENYPSILRFFCPSKVVYVYIPMDDINKIKDNLRKESEHE